ncbi:hypothetical protein Bca52824_061894 [Brassica carinata]|uniref:Uncharacterized protein n=1 Tax=Brassica carinata TaxID=52824 RepID=A0A8X7QH16_BRACI|nr:hypothetical protein Bca52824_061894 [Brassica carinata]
MELRSDSGYSISNKLSAFRTFLSRLSTTASQRHPWMELIDRSSFASHDRFKFHSFIYVFAPSWPSYSANSNHAVDLFRLLYSSPLSTENRAPDVSASRFFSTLQILVPGSGHQTISAVFLYRCHHARIQDSSCSSLPSQPRYGREGETMVISYACNPSPPTFSYSRVGPNFSKCIDSFTNRP